MQTVRSFVGMDVHKATISISVAEDGRNGPVRFLGVIPNQPDDITKMAKRLSRVNWGEDGTDTEVVELNIWASSQAG
jgi:hypothetical protein